MSRVFFTSDLHIGHENLVKFFFNISVEEHCNRLIENWNKVVTKRDKVYILGDIAMEKINPLVDKFFQSTNGTKVLIAGNHDSWNVISYCLEKQYIKEVYGMTRYKGFFLTHAPVDMGQLIINHHKVARGNIHGHIHTEFENSLLDNRLYYNVNTQFHDFTPVLFDDISKNYGDINEACASIEDYYNILEISGKISKESDNQ